MIAMRRDGVGRLSKGIHAPSVTFLFYARIDRMDRKAREKACQSDLLQQPDRKAYMLMIEEKVWKRHVVEPRAGKVSDRAAQSGKADRTGGPDWTAVIRLIGTDRDRAAFATLFSYFAPRIKAYLIKGGASEPLAEECVQDVMTTIWQKSTQFDPSRAAVSTWIYTIARNRRIDLIRRQRRPEPEDLSWGPEAEPDQADAVALQQETEKLAVALARLPEKQRHLVERSYFGELTHSEIAAETGLPLGTIKSRLRLALERLRHSMSEDKRT